MARVREFDTEAAVDAALEAFRTHGYEGTSIQDLVDATGVGRGSLYAAFGNKEGLYRVALDRYRTQYALPLADLLQQGVPLREMVREMLVAAIDQIAADGNHRACLVVGAAMERAGHDPEVAGRLRETVTSLEESLTEVLVAGQERGELDAATDPRAVARFLVTTLQGLRVMGAIDPDRGSLLAAAEVALTCLR
ncbi:TetR/AcrR family transcriptional regulator [Streptomyces sp. NPDC029554]|uniref:TetR/AcrR family transcriptional regulator n=1 Tax=Streptomyces sp. NPDC029554 TaxID=3155126 RepID=UPI0033C36B97